MLGYNINIQICGWSSPEILANLAMYASEVQENGCIVELGTFAGRSAYALGMNKKDSVKLYCYDKWHINPNIIPRAVGSFGQNVSPDGTKNKQLYNIETVRENLRKVSNLHLIQSWLPLPEDKMIFEDESVDLIYIDAGHTYAQTKADIEQWYPKIKKGGVLYFDDYSQECWPGVVQAVDEFCKKYNEDIKVFRSYQAICRKRS